MNQKRIWKEYISAQSKILEHKSKSIGIDNSNPIQFNGLKLNLSIDQEIFKQVFNGYFGSFCATHFGVIGSSSYLGKSTD